MDKPICYLCYLPYDELESDSHTCPYCGTGHYEDDDEDAFVGDDGDEAEDAFAGAS